ncbi:uncharacterized protein LOC124138844 [Haliotis rufescens]|uniref:uncharacterized protein LOC124138844 n=1 Tax=Haliotis rufescens TaxID=6454 RepID=UPI00201F32B1|nr:uncharacterized protein LOC124138844 [Haliotis rufescens]
MSGTLRTRLQTSHVFLMSGLSGEERKKYGKIIQQLGGIYFDIESFKASCTHLICGKLSRSEKYLGACATGRWILKPEYLTASDRVKEWLPEEDFEWQPKHGQKSQSDPLVLAPIRWRLQFSLTGEPAFKGWKVSVVVSDNKRGHVYKRLLKSGGADVYSVKLPVDNPTKIANTIAYVFTDGKMAVQLYDQSLMEYGVLLVKPEFIGDYLLQDPRPDPMDYLATVTPCSKSPGDHAFIMSSQKSLSQSSQASQTLKSKRSLISELESLDGTFLSLNSSLVDARTPSSSQGSRTSSLRTSKRFSDCFPNDKDPDSSVHPVHGSQRVSNRKCGTELEVSVKRKQTKRLSRSASSTIKQGQNLGALPSSQESRSQNTAVIPDADTVDFVMEDGHISFERASVGLDSTGSSQCRQRMSRRQAGVEPTCHVVRQVKELSQGSKNAKREISDPDPQSSLKTKSQSQQTLNTFVKKHHNSLSVKKGLEMKVSVALVDIDMSSSQEGRQSPSLAPFKGIQSLEPTSTALVKKHANNQTLDPCSVSGETVDGDVGRSSQELRMSLKRATRLTTSNSDKGIKTNNSQNKCSSQKQEKESLPSMTSSEPVPVSDSPPCPSVRSGLLRVIRSRVVPGRGSLPARCLSDSLAARTRPASTASSPGSVASCLSVRSTPDLEKRIKMDNEVKNSSQKKLSHCSMSSFVSSPLSQGSSRKVSQSSLGDFGFSSTSKQRPRNTVSRNLTRSVSASQGTCSQPEVVSKKEMSTYLSRRKEVCEVAPDNKEQDRSTIDVKPDKVIEVKKKTSVTPTNPLVQSCAVKRKIFEDDVDDADDGVQPLTKKMKLKHPVQPWCPLWSGVKVDHQTSNSDYTLPGQMPSSVSNIINICIEENFQLEALTMTQASIQTYPSSHLLHTLMTQVLLKAKSRHISQMAYRILMNILTAHPPNSKLMRGIYLNSFYLLEDGHGEGVWEFISFVVGGALSMEQDAHRGNHCLLLQFLVTVFRHSFRSFVSELQSSDEKQRRKLLRSCMLVQCLWYPSYLLFPNSRTQQLLDFVGQCLLLPSDCTHKGQLLESVLSLVSMATQCCQIADHGEVTSGYPDIGERTSLFVNALARNISGCSIKEETTLLTTLRNLQPDWLCLRIVQLLLAKMDDYLLVKGLDLGHLNLTKIVSQYIFLLPRLSSTKIAMKEIHKRQLRRHGRPEECDEDQQRDGSGERLTQHMAAKINKTNNKGETALHMACIKNNIVKLKQLLTVPGVDVNAQDHAGWTPLHEACNKGHVECVDTLLKHVPARTIDSYLSKNQTCKKVDLLACTPDGITPLHDAVASNRLDVCRLLLTHGGPSLLTAKTSRGQCPSDLARTPSMRTLLTTLPTPMKHRGMDFHSSQESQDSPRSHKIDFMPAPFLYQQVLGEEGNEAMADITDCRLYVTLVTHLVLSYIHASRLLSRHQTHIQQTHTHQTHTQQTHTHTQQKHTHETHTQQTHMQQTHTQQTHTHQTHMQQTHMQQTHTHQTHTQQTRPVSFHTVKVVPEVAVKENQRPGRVSTRVRKQPAIFDSYDMGKRKVLQEDLTNAETAFHGDKSKLISLGSHEAMLETVDEEDDLYIFQRIKSHLRNFTRHISKITSADDFKLLETKLSVMMFYIAAASSKK